MSSRSILVRNGRIIDPARSIDRVGSLLIADGKIRSVGDRIELRPEYELIDAEGMMVCPGFIDLHCHLRQPGFEEKETIATGTRAAARGGFTTVCCMPNTNPPLDSPEAIQSVKAIAAKEGVVNVLPIGCITQGRKGAALADLAKLAAAGAIGFSDDGSPVMDDKIMRQALEKSRGLGLPVIDHCEDLSLSKDGQINEGVMSTKLGLKGWPAAAEERMVARDLELAEVTGGKLHVAHVSTAGSAELIRRAKAKGINVTAEVTPHHLTLTEAIITRENTNAKVSPPLRTEKDVQVLIRGLKEGVIDIIATDHAPHAEKDKKCQFSQAAFGISGFETALGSLMKLVHGGQLTLAELIAKLTSAPAGVIGQKRLGTLAVDAPADITIFDPNKAWVVDPAGFASKGKNTPLAGMTLKGKVMATIVAGKVVYKDERISKKVKVS